MTVLVRGLLAVGAVVVISWTPWYLWGVAKRFVSMVADRRKAPLTPKGERGL